MKHSLRGALAAAAAVATAGAVAVLAAPSAHAASGTVTLNPATGYITGTPTFVTSAPCSNGSSAYTLAFLSGGPNNWDPETYLWKAPAPVSQGSGVSLSLLSFAIDNGLTLATGTYDIEFICTDRDLTGIYDSFTGQVQISVAGTTAAQSDTYTAVTPAATATSASATATDTTSASPTATDTATASTTEPAA